MPREQTVLKPLVGEQIWVCERPVRFQRAWMRARSVVVRLESGDLWVHSPPEPTDALTAAIDALGPVKWVVVPNKFHHLETPLFAQAYPDATVIGPRSAVERNTELRLGADIADLADLADLAEPALTSQFPELQALPLSGVPFLDETVFFHHPTKTLIAADLALSATPEDHWSFRVPGRLLGFFGKVKVPPDVRLHTRPCAEAARALEAILALPIERIAVAHTDLITDRPVEQLARAWRFVLRKFPPPEAPSV